MLLDPEELATLRLEQLGDKLRGQGRLEEAQQAYERLLSIAPRNLKAERLFSSLSQSPATLPSIAGGLKSTPFFIASDLLPHPVRDAILKYMISKTAAFGHSQTNEGFFPQLRRSLSYPNFLNDFDRNLRDTFEELLEALFPKIIRQLQIPLFEPTFLEVHGLMYRNGDFFRAHNDTGAHNTRRITFVLTLHHQPRHFKGGDLLLYDTFFRTDAMALAERPFAATYTRLTPEDNRIIVFPSEFYHEVTPIVTSKSPRHARFSINGWFHTSAEEGDSSYIAGTPY